jgi:hypothetical protein
MELSEKRVSVSPHVLVRAMQRESVLLNLDRESYFGLDEVGTRMWNVLVESPSVKEAFRVLEEEYDVDGPALWDDLHRFIGELADAGLVEVHDL